MRPPPIHTDRGGVIPSASGANHPAEDLHSVGGDVPSGVGRLLPDHGAVQHDLHRGLADGDVEL